MADLTFTPNAKQWQFLLAKRKHIAFGGARGGGKSWAVRAKAIILAERYGGEIQSGVRTMGIKILIVRRTYQELINNHIMPMRSMLLGVATYNKQEKMFSFRNGSIIKFGYCDNDNDVEQYQGAEYDCIFIDEATNLKQEWIEKIVACCRGVNDYPKHIYYTCNPGGIGHAYIKRLFVDRDFIPGEYPEDYEFIQARVTDNTVLMKMQPDYKRQLEMLPPKLRKAWLDGDWDIFDGAFFEEFRNDPDHYEDKRWTHVINPILPDRGWTCFRTFDYGYAKPFSVGWNFIDYDGVMYRALEWYGVQRINGLVNPDVGIRLEEDQLFKEIYRIEHEHPLLKGRHIEGVADPAIFKQDRETSIYDHAVKQHVYFSPGDNNRLAGWQECHHRLRFDENGYPSFYVTRNCKQFIRTITLMQYDEKKPEDLDTTLEDHAMDEFRYGCMYRKMAPEKLEAKYYPMFGADPLNQFTKINKYVRRKYGN